MKNAKYDEEDEYGFSVEGAVDQRGVTYVIVRKRGKVAYVPLTDFLFGLAVAIGKLAQQGVNIILPAQQRRLREVVDAIDKPTLRIFVATRPGWLTSTAFMLPDGTLFAAGKLRTTGVIRNFEPAPGFGMQGDLAAWKAALLSPMRGQRLLQGLAAFALSAPLLRDFAQLAGFTDNPMLNIVGSSSSGKTTSTRVAGSIYGYGIGGTWLTTSNAVEDKLLSHADSLMILDEAHLAGTDARSRSNLLGNTVMVLASGQGKARKGQAPLPSARCVVISTSNTYVTSAAPNGAAIDPALQVRMPVIDLLGRKHGILDTVMNGDAVSIINALNRAVQQFGGAPIRAYLARLTFEMADNPERLRLKVAAGIEVFNRVARRDGPLSSLEERISGRFALADVAGLLATTWGIFPPEWNSGGAGTQLLFQMARDALRAAAHSDPIARFELVLERMRPRLHEEGRSAGMPMNNSFIGAVSRRQNGVIEFVIRKVDFTAGFGSIDPQLLVRLRASGALAVEAVGQDGAVRPTVKRALLPGGMPERLIAIRLDPSAYPAALKVRRFD